MDAGSFMWDFHRSIRSDQLPDGETVLSVQLLDVEKHAKWWMICKDGDVDLCTDNPGKDVDLYLSGPLEAFASVWMGDQSAQQAIQDDALFLTGSSHLSRTANAWFPQSRYSDVRPKRIVGEEQRSD